MKTLAYHFTDGMDLRDGQELIEGKTYIHDGPIEICKSGLHASRRVIDALQYAPNGTLSVVECSGIEEEHIDKFVCRERKVLETHDVTRLLQSFALDVAEEVVEKCWNVEGDTRSLDAIRIAKSFLEGKATLDELEDARNAASDAYNQYRKLIKASLAMFNTMYYATKFDKQHDNTPHPAYNTAYYAAICNMSLYYYNSQLVERLQKVFKTSLDF